MNDKLYELYVLKEKYINMRNNLTSCVDFFKASKYNLDSTSKELKNGYTIDDSCSGCRTIDSAVTFFDESISNIVNLYLPEINKQLEKVIEQIEVIEMGTAL